jgi:hypothetical protein
MELAMRTLKILLITIMAAATGITVAASSATAAPDAEGTVTIESVTCASLGLPALCDDALYTAIKTYKVYADTNPSNPMPSPGHFTYIYKIVNDPSSTMMVGSLRRFDTETPASGTIAAGFLDGSSVEPNDVEVQSTVVRWVFESDFIDPGEASEELYLVSAFGPGEVTDTTVGVGSAFAIDTQTTSVGPVMAPPAVPCTIGFWKNRELKEEGLLKFFPGSNFDDVKAEAVAISSVFASEAELIAALTSKGARSMEARAKQQLAALLLNVAAGNLYSSNTKCRLFTGEHGTEIDTTGDGVADTNIEAALVLIESNILSGEKSLIAAAQSLADDINNGVGVLNQAVFE